MKMEKTRKNNSKIGRLFWSFDSKRRLSVVHLMLAFMIIIILAGGIYFASRSGSDPRIYTNDFNVYYHAAREVMAGRDPYQDSLRPSTPYLYPPLLSEAILPLALLPLPIAAYIWYLVSLISILCAAWMAAGLGCQTIRPNQDQAGSGRFKIRLQIDDISRLRIVIAAGGLLMLMRFVLDNFDFGQVNTLVAALAVAHVYFYVKEKKTASALALVFAVSIKLTPIILILYHLARSRFRFVAACIGLLVVVSVLSFFPFGTGALDAFPVFLNRTIMNGQGFDLSFSGNQSLRGAIERLTETSDQKADMYGGESRRTPMTALTVLISTALIALSILVALMARDDMSAAAPFFCCFVLLSPLSWKAHFVVLILPIAYLIARMLSPTEKRRAYIIGAIISIFALFNITSPKLFGPEWGEWTDAHSLVCAGAALMFISIVGVGLAPARIADLAGDAPGARQP
jgi:alpha-1,2-mannosyltransferase